MQDARPDRLRSVFEVVLLWMALNLDQPQVVPPMPPSCSDDVGVLKQNVNHDRDVRGGASAAALRNDLSSVVLSGCTISSALSRNIDDS